ncbi:MAG TPA: M48 family metallopeptidase [Luteimonas sp.]|nr:M48 family metallopeptidase [Luteimonas sp.]
MESAAAHGALVARLERESRESPGLYRFKLGVLACLGFVVLGGSAIVALGLSVGLAVGLAMLNVLLLLKLAKIIWIPIAFGWFLLKALWIRFDAPQGHRLQPGEAPELVAEVERLRRETGAPRLEAILIDSDLNAAAASVPRVSGLFGHRHYLVLGLPLMQLLGREEMLSVIAHEFGHFGGGHGRFGSWIYRVRVSWYRVLGALEASGSSLTRLFTRFFNWYAPYFNAYSFALARANEYQADAIAARVVGAPVAARALVRVHLGSQRLDRDFWPRIRAANQAEPAPPDRLYRDMAVQLRMPTADDGTRLSEGLAAVAGLDDTHPTLAQRLAALGADAHVGDVATVDAPAISAAEALLGPLAGELEARFSDDWRQAVGPAWEDNHQEHVSGLARLDVLASLDVRDPDQACEYARLMETLHPDMDAMPLYATAVEAASADAFCNFRLGALLLERGDGAGIRHLRVAMDQDPDAIEPAAMLLVRHYDATGDVAGRRAVEQDVDALHRSRRKALQARSRVTSSDRYLPHALDAGQAEALCRQLHVLGTVKKAWLVRKAVGEGAGDLAHFVMLVTWRGWALSQDARLQRVVDAIELPGSFVVITAPNQRWIAWRLRRAAGRPVYGG